jgi:hypothetical protein
MFVESLVGYHQTGSCELESRSWRGVLDTTFCDKTCQWLAAGRLFSPGTPVRISRFLEVKRHVVVVVFDPLQGKIYLD